MLFQLSPKITTLDDLERPYHTVLHKWCVFRSSSRKLERRQKHYYQQQKCCTWSLLSGGIRFLRIFVGILWRGALKRQWGGQNRWVLVTSPLSTPPYNSITICSLTAETCCNVSVYCHTLTSNCNKIWTIIRNPRNNPHRRKCLTISLYHAQPAYKIATKSVRKFLSYPADGRTDKRTDHVTRPSSADYDWLGLSWYSTRSLAFYRALNEAHAQSTGTGCCHYSW